MHKFPYKWNLKDSIFTKDKGKVFSCFACGGGSTMGYKLAGFDVIGCNEVDPKMMEVYRLNHNPKYSFLEPIQTFKNRDDLPKELFELDILDGSPPCSSFSMAGNREKDWGKKKVFREGQSEQVLDTLFFDYIDLAKKLQPKIVVAENVKGILLGNAKKYVDKIHKEFDNAGYYSQHYLLNSSKMGVPQERERVFFIALRNDLINKSIKKDLLFGMPKLNLDFNEKEIPFNEISQKDLEFDNEKYIDIWNKMPEGGKRSEITGTGFSCIKVKGDKPIPTIIASQRMNSLSGLVHNTQCRSLNNLEFCLAGTFPLDYDYSTNKKSKNFLAYLVGMSVPPVMIAQISSRIYEQWLRHIN
jgi:DNA (cytosine-5)-methyltransferase 1